LLRVLTLSSLFPDAVRPTFGPFVEKQTLGLAAHPDVELQVIAPIGLPPGPLAWLDRYARFNTLPLKEDWKGVTVHRPRFLHIPGAGGRFDPGMMARALLPMLRRLHVDFPFDVIDASFFFPDGPAAVRLGKALGVPVSIKARGSDIHYWGEQPQTKPQILDAARGAEGLLAVSAALKADMVAMGIKADKIRVHYTGVDHSLFKPVDRTAAKTKLGISGPLIVTVASLVALKRQDLIISALAKLPDATLVLIGHGPEEARYRALAERLGVGGRVRFTGAIPHDQIAVWLAAADVMALASEAEGLANAWVEALACGTPLVITDVGGAREVLDRPEAGHLVPFDADAIAVAILELIDHPPVPAAVRACAARFTWEANTAALYEHLSGICVARMEAKA
jgi:teichuronic acid biosynthesis glycosyltransferase TuaC